MLVLHRARVVSRWALPSCCVPSRAALAWLWPGGWGTAPTPLWVGVQVGRVLGLEAADLAVFYAAPLTDVGCGAVLALFFAGQELGPAR
jgi:hypothetical protein